VHVGGLAQGVVGVVVAELALPHGVHEVGFFVVGRLLQQAAAFEVFAVRAVALAFGEETLFFVGFGNDGGYGDGSGIVVRRGDGCVGERTCFLVLLSSETMVNWQVRRMSSSLTF